MPLYALIAPRSRYAPYGKVTIWDANAQNTMERMEHPPSQTQRRQGAIDADFAWPPDSPFAIV